MDNSIVETPGTVALEPPSTVLNPETVKTVSGGGNAPLRDADDSGSISSVLAAELKSLRDADAAKEKPVVEKPVIEKDAKADKIEKPATKIEKAGKVENTADGDDDDPEDAEKSAAAKGATGQEVQERQRQSEGREHQQPPARFLPKAKEVWANVPNAVKADIDRVFKEHEAEVSQYRTAHQEYEQIKDFDELAKRGGTTLRNALSAYTGVENLLRTNPVQGVAEVLRNIGISPIQYAQHVLNNPQLHEYKGMPAPSPQQQQQVRSPEIDELKQQIASMRHEQVARDIITPFREANPRYDELQEDIAFFLQSGKIPSSLSPVERLEAAYDMAARINPGSASYTPPPATGLDDEKPVPSKDAGTKSIRGAPTDGKDAAVTEGKSSIRDILGMEMRKMKRA